MGRREREDRTMDYFSALNTEGFSESDLAMMNSALDAIFNLLPGIDEKSVSDALNNAWIEGIERDALIRAAVQSMGVALDAA